MSGSKTWELRASATKIRGKIALIQSGSGLVVGTCDLVDVKGPLSLADLKASTHRHRVSASDFGDTLPYQRTHAWVLANAHRLASPVSYKHPMGAVIWVNLDPRVGRWIEQDGG